MYQKVLQSAANPVVSPQRLAAFGRFDLPEQYVSGSSPAVTTDDYALLLTFIQASTEEVEKLAQWAILTEQVVETADFYPNTQDPRQQMQYQLSYAYNVTPFSWFGIPVKDGVELVRRPVQVPALTGNAAAVTVVSVAHNVVTVTTSLNPAQGAVVLLSGTAEGNVAAPTQTPSTTPFLNGVPLTVLTTSGTQFTATFNNFYTTNGQGTVVPGSYTNNADTGTAQVWSNPVVITYFDANGVQNIWSTIYYYVAYDKIQLTVGSVWPITDRRQDCIQITYWAGDLTQITSPTQHARLQMAVMYLANHMWENRTLMTVEPTSEVGRTLCQMISQYRTARIPR